MLTDNSTQSFIRKLCEKQREHSSKLYMQSIKDKENISRKSNIKPQNHTQKKMRTESSPAIMSNLSVHEWALDISTLEKQELVELMGDWLCLPEGMYRFQKVYRRGDWDEDISKKVKELESNSQFRKCIIIELNCLGNEINFTNLLTQYSLPLLKFGKSSWSVAALSPNRKFDLLSLDCEGSPIWKAKQPLSKVQLQREQLLRRVFGYASEKQKSLSIQQILAKVSLPSNNIIYFILKRPEVEQPVSKLLIQQEIIIEGITVSQKYSVLAPQSLQVFNVSLIEALKMMGISLKKQQQLSKADKQNFLKCMISKLECQLNSQKEELKQYIQSEIIEEQQYTIPSERISMSQKYKHLQRNIKATDNAS